MRGCEIPIITTQRTEIAAAVTDLMNLGGVGWGVTRSRSIGIGFMLVLVIINIVIVI